MRRNNQFSTPEEIRSSFKSVRDPNRHAGVPVYGEYGQLWVDDSHRHVQVIGNTGEGKSQGAVLPFARDCLHRGENLILLNVKNECYRALAGHVPDHYQKFFIDLSNPWNSPDQWDPFAYITALYRSGDPRDRDRACSAVHEFWDGLLDRRDFDEAFWPDSAATYLKGLVFGLLELAEPRQVNLESVDSMMCHAEERFGAHTFTRALYDILPEGSLARTNLNAYVFAPNETRMSMFATARRGLAVFGLSQGLRQLLMRDTLDIAHLDLHRPFVFFISMPQHTGIYATLAALLVNQLITHLEYSADRRSDQRLPIRTHLVVEEVGKVGHGIPSLPGILEAGRSKGIRAMLVMQSGDQLTEVYGPAKARAINACSDLKICFSTSCSDTLRQWSEDCGLTDETVDGVTRSVPLITPTELRGMEVGEALVMTKHLKFRSRLPFYYQLTALQETPEPVCPPRPAQVAEALDIRELVKAHKRKEMMDALNTPQGTATGPNKRNADGTLMLPPMLPDEDDAEAIFRKVPSIDELNRLFDRRRKKPDAGPGQEGPRGFNVIVLDAGKKPRDVAKAVAGMLNIPFPEALQQLNAEDKPVSIPFQSHLSAEQAQRKLAGAGATAIIAPMLTPIP